MLQPAHIDAVLVHPFGGLAGLAAAGVATASRLFFMRLLAIARAFGLLDIVWVRYLFVRLYLYSTVYLQDRVEKQAGHIYKTVVAALSLLKHLVSPLISKILLG